MKGISVTLLVTLALVGASVADVKDYFNGQTQGKGTWHSDGWPGNNGVSGRCTYNAPQPFPSPSGILFKPVAIDAGAWENGLTCGMCAIVFGRGENGTALPVPGTTFQDDPLPPLSQTPMMVYVVNYCDGCNGGYGPGFDTYYTSDGGSGAWQLTWQAVDCPVGESKLSYQMQGANPFYMKLQVRGARIPIKALQIVVDGKTYDLENQAQDGFFVADGISPSISGGFTVKVTGINDEVLTDTIASVTNDQIFAGTVQFSAYKPYSGNITPGGDGDGGDGDGGDGNDNSAAASLDTPLSTLLL